MPLPFFLENLEMFILTRKIFANFVCEVTVYKISNYKVMDYFLSA